uniref:DM13 domain-containing protein n=1 Tax=Panagrellus redivivus TaxID=6233 RepID=A0A7E4V1Z3_PANRE
MPKAAILCTIVSILPFLCYGSDPINPAYAAPSSGKRFGGAIVPWSEYRRKMEEQKWKSWTPDQDPTQPVTLYLPPFKPSSTKTRDYFPSKPFHGATDVTQRSETSAEVSDGHRPTITTSRLHPPPPSSIRSEPPMSRPGFSYATNAHRQPMGQNTTYSTLSRPQSPHPPHPQVPIIRRHDANAMPSPIVPQQPHLPPMISNGLPITAAVNPGTPGMSQMGNSAAQFSKLAPAPLGVMSQQRPENFVNSIFSQSQYRYAPQQGPAFGVPNTHPELATDLIANAAGAGGGGNPVTPDNAFGGLNPFQLLSTARDSPVEQIARVAKNLLSHENQELFAAMSKLLQKPAQQLTSSALSGAEKSAVEEGAEAIQLISSSANKDGNTTADKEEIKPVDSAKIDLKTSTDKSELTLSELEKLKSAAKSEDERLLLEAAIRNNELVPESLGALETNQTTPNAHKSIIKSEHKALEWIQQNRPPKGSTPKSGKKAISAQDLPYYGRYCGVFAEQINATNSYEIGGALWAVDHRRFIVSKFHFKPSSSSDNITFWAGPKRITGNPVHDTWPSANGVYLKPVPIDITIFTLKEYPVVNATVRHPVVVNNESIAEAEDEARVKRDVFSNVYENRIPFKLSANFNDGKNGAEVLGSASVDELTNSTVDIVTTTTEVAMTSVPVVVTSDVKTTTATIPTTTVTPLDQSKMTPLEWYAGFQPLLLTLPDDINIKNTHWVSIYDHHKQAPVSMVLIPNGNAFQIPSIVQLRPFTAQPGYTISSGPIVVRDTKTIEVTEFSLETRGIPVWFMVGKEVVPNGNGHIVPIFDRGSFDCSSLRDYHNETVTLRLPGSLDIRDVFWFSVFSIPQAASMAHMYLPYNDIHLPPDLNGQATPVCQWVRPAV